MSAFYQHNAIIIAQEYPFPELQPRPAALLDCRTRYFNELASKTPYVDPVPQKVLPGTAAIISGSNDDVFVEETVQGECIGVSLCFFEVILEELVVSPIQQLVTMDIDLLSNRCQRWSSE